MVMRVDDDDDGWMGGVMGCGVKEVREEGFIYCRITMRGAMFIEGGYVYVGRAACRQAGRQHQSSGV